jgi:hypothetical protein
MLPASYTGTVPRVTGHLTPTGTGTGHRLAVRPGL